MIFAKELNIAIVGAGGFATFAAKSFLKIPGIKIISVYDIIPSLRQKLATELNADACSDLENILENKDIDLVYIATPPFLHYEQSKKSLLAGKHVICEKPAALKTSEAEELSGLAKKLKLLYVVNLMQRYNPLYATVKTIIDENILGNFLHGFFENYAIDEALPATHWFWDAKKSGGILIEHGVHFFDMFHGWLGDGKIVSAIQVRRPGIEANIYDRFQATVNYGGALVNFYHAFDQPAVLEKQELRLVFEKGEINLYEWIPVKLMMTALLRKQQLKRLQELLGNPSVVYLNQFSQENKVQGRFKEIIYDDHVTIERGTASEKHDRYCSMVTAMLMDQWKWIINPEHKRIIDDSNAINSLKMAEEATAIVQKL